MTRLFSGQLEQAFPGCVGGTDLMNAEQARRLAAVAGVLVVISIFAGGFAEVYVPGKLLVASDPAATARNVAVSPQLFRLSFLVYLIEAVCDVSLALLFYVLLRPVNPTLSLLAAFFGIVSTATFPQYDSDFFLAPMFAAMITLASWLLLKGVIRERWPTTSHS
jgi:Domain of unknown function (DUF4386)